MCSRLLSAGTRKSGKRHVRTVRPAVWEEGSFSGFLPARFSFSANREEQRAEKEKEGRASREINAVIRENGRRNNERQDRKGRSRGAGHVQDLEEQEDEAHGQTCRHKGGNPALGGEPRRSGSRRAAQNDQEIEAEGSFAERAARVDEFNTGDDEGRGQQIGRWPIRYVS